MVLPTTTLLKAGDESTILSLCWLNFGMGVCTSQRQNLRYSLFKMHKMSVDVSLLVQFGGISTINYICACIQWKSLWGFSGWETKNHHISPHITTELIIFPWSTTDPTS